jgi:hypothetical protein
VKPIAEMSLGEFAAFVSSHLEKNGIHAVLSGGAAVSIHTGSRYQSFDLDFVERVGSERRRLREVLAEIGFGEEARYFVHPESEYFVDFPAGPLAVGREPVKNVEELGFSTGRLAILSPTDCVKDRLAAFYYWDDSQSLDQALLVAECKPVDLNEVRRWSTAEGKAEQFETIRRRLVHAVRKSQRPRKQ